MGIVGRLALVEDEIGRSLAQAHASGELRIAENYGRPLPEASGWDDTPDEFRMPFKILRDAGFAPPEVSMFHQRAELRAQRNACADASERDALDRKLSELEQKISLRLEALRSRGTL